MLRIAVIFVHNDQHKQTFFSFFKDFVALVVFIFTERQESEAQGEWERHTARSCRPGVKPAAAAGLEL